MGHRAVAIQRWEEHTSCNTKVKITTSHIKSTIDKAHSAVDLLKNWLPEDDRMRPKQVASNVDYIYIFNDILNILQNIY
jgi:hypothetical protein